MRTQVIGRNRELSELESILLAPADAPTPAVVLHGRRGIGKTALAASLAQRAGAHGIDVVWATESTLLDIPPNSLVIVDDATDADAATLKRLHALLQTTRSLRVLVLCRGTRYRLRPDLARWLSQIDAVCGCRFLMLRPLEPEAADAIARAILGDAATAEIVVGIGQRTDGDPSLIREFARVVRHDRERDLTVEVPETVAGLVGLRLAALAEEPRGVTETASLFTGAFALEWLAPAVGLDEQRTLLALRCAEDAGLVDQRGDDRFEMSAPVVRDAIRSLTFGGHLQQAHRRVAERLMLLPENSGSAAEAARQFHSSRKLPGAERGVEPALQAAGQALAARSPLRAAELLELGLELCVGDRPGAQAKLTGALAEAWAGALCHAEAITTLELACQRLRAAGVASAKIADLAVEVADALSLAVAGVDGSAPQRIKILVGGTDEPTAERLDVALHSRPPQMHTPTALGDRMVRVAMAGDARRRSAAVFRAATETVEVLLDPALTRPLLEQAQEGAAMLGSGGAKSLAFAVRAVAAARAGDLSSAIDLAQAGVDAYLRLGRTHREPPVAHLIQLLTQLHVDPDQERLAASAARLVANRWPTPYAVSLTAIVAVARVRAGDAAGARTALHEVIAALAATPRYSQASNAALGPAVEAAWRLGAPEPGQRLLPIARRLLDAGGGDFYMSQRDLIWARLAALAGRADEAKTAYRRAISALDEANERTLRPSIDLEFNGASEPDERAVSARPDGLTLRQLEVLVLISDGLTNQQIAERLVLSVNTVNRHAADIYRKIGAQNRVAAASYVTRHGLAR